MKNFCSATLSVVILAGFTGCETAPVQSAGPAPQMQVQAPAASAPVAQAPVASAPLPVSAAARAAAQRLMEGTQPHEILKISAFAAYPQFTTQNWSGLVLNSKVSTQSLAHTSNFRVLRIEIHPLLDGRVRVWVEITNTSSQKVTPEIACQFTPEDADKNAKFTTLPEMGPGKNAVTYFESHENAPYAYSILARNKRQ